jgi:dCMP deaminase
VRPTKHDYYLEIARAVAKRSTCRRRQYGAVIVNHDEIVATGYNGAPRGVIDCLERGKCWREENGVPHGEQYEKCLSVHAEQNAIISASRAEMIGATLYLVGFENGAEIPAEPCTLCARMIVNAGIATVHNIRGGCHAWLKLDNWMEKGDNK